MDFLEALFGPYYERNGGFIMVRAISEFGDRGSVSFFPNIQTLGMATFPKDKNIFFGVTPREKMKTGREHIRFVTALWASLDVAYDGFAGKDGRYASLDEARAAATDLPLAPSIVVSSGRGLHLYWLLKEVKEIAFPEAAETLLSRLNLRFRCATDVPLDSALRLPGTINQRCSPVAYCRVETLDAGKRYSGTDFQSTGLLNPPRGAADDDEEKTPTIVAEIDEEPANGESPTRRAASTMPGLRLVPQEPTRPARAAAQNVRVAPDDDPAGMSAVTEVRDWRQWSAPPEAMIDEIAERVTDRMSEGFCDDLADKVAGRVLEKLARLILNRGQDS
jgi:hypothetical protein